MLLLYFVQSFQYDIDDLYPGHLAGNLLFNCVGLVLPTASPSSSQTSSSSSGPHQLHRGRLQLSGLSQPREGLEVLNSRLDVILKHPPHLSCLPGRGISKYNWVTWSAEIVRCGLSPRRHSDVRCAFPRSQVAEMQQVEETSRPLTLTGPPEDGGEDDQHHQDLQLWLTVASLQSCVWWTIKHSTGCDVETRKIVLFSLD